MFHCVYIQHFLYPFFIEVYLLCDISFRCTTQWFSVVICRLYSKFTIKCWLDSLCCKYMHVAYLLYTQYLVPLNLLLLSCPSLCLQRPGVCSLDLWVCFHFVIFLHLFYFLDSTYKWSHTVFVFLWHISRETF